ncbi:MAG TPA: phytanoyl-CoA dioxygenase family protein [Solirubrobacterales bacterium]|nr:phytanoyl-CoA dioxygenase family protein [Solirubrobacterales bacterium]
MIFSALRKRRSGVALDEPPAELAARRSTEDLIAEIEDLTRSNRESRDPESEVRLVLLRHAAGIRLMEDSGVEARFPEPAFDRLPDRNGELAGITADQLSPEVLRAGILRDGCLLVRGVLSRDEADYLVEQINSAFDARAALRRGQPADPGYYRELPLEPRFAGEEGGREWTAAGGGLWVADSPHLMFEMLDCFERAGLTNVIDDYLGERPTISVQKCTLRKVNPDAGHGWHQDGAFLGDVRALNVWLALSRCGDESPGMDIVPKRLDHIVPTGTEGAIFDWSVAPQLAEEAAGETGVLRPIFEPGDVLLFDELFLHSTAADPSMKKSRMAIESWFFGASASPRQYAPLAV